MNECLYWILKFVFLVGIAHVLQINNILMNSKSWWAVLVYVSGLLIIEQLKNG